ncbi:glycosyltransferase family 2 protein [Puia sp.]|jgi:GT2 family glycosyltransferase|uniref:glycosyltransferase family 2 protein n=1 Tax=Puia sp. TaxID=2045100 RepID=UPI002F424789
MIYIVIPVYNRWAYTKACLESLRRQTNKKFVTVVVDHGSEDGTAANIAAEFPDTVVLKGDKSMWWTSATNLGVRYALQHQATHILTLNNDLRVGEEYLAALREAAAANPRAIIGSVSLNIDAPEQVVFAGVRWSPWNSKYRNPIPVDMNYSQLKARVLNIPSNLLPGRGTLIPEAVFREIGLFDDEIFPHYMADEDFSLRAVKAGYSLLVNTRCVVFSHVAATGLAEKKKKGLSYLRESFTSKKSPSKLSVRWNWASRHGKIPIFYFFMDFGRVFVSQLFKSF